MLLESNNIKYKNNSILWAARKSGEYFKVNFSENLLIDVSLYGDIKNIDAFAKQIKTTT